MIINDNALVALALLIAESEPKAKDLIIALIKNLLVETTFSKICLFNLKNNYENPQDTET